MEACWRIVDRSTAQSYCLVVRSTFLHPKIGESRPVAVESYLVALISQDAAGVLGADQSCRDHEGREGQSRCCTGFPTRSCQCRLGGITVSIRALLDLISGFSICKISTYRAAIPETRIADAAQSKLLRWGYPAHIQGFQSRRWKI